MGKRHVNGNGAFVPIEIKRSKEGSPFWYAKDTRGRWWNVELDNKSPSLHIVRANWQVTSERFINILKRQDNPQLILL